MRLLLLFFVLIFTSCNSLEITKRRYRPGFHVEFAQNCRETKQYKSEAQVSLNKAVSELGKKVNQVEYSNSFKSNIVHTEELGVLNLDPIRETTKNRTGAHSESGADEDHMQELAVIAREIKNQYLNKEEAKGWSKLAIAAAGLSFLSVTLMIVAIGLLAPQKEEFRVAGWTVLIVQFLLGLAGFITGLVSRSIAKRKGLEGRGLGTVAFVFGLVGMGTAVVFWLFSMLTGFTN